MSAADLSVPLRDALIGNAAITSQLPAYKGSFPIFTRRPAPTDITYPIIMISPDVTIDDEDGINDFRPIQVRDVVVYGQNDTPAKYRVVEVLGYAIREMFHSTRLSIVVPSFTVTLITARGPMPAPTDDDQTVARIVSLTIRLARKG